jgi:N-terminal acetyltransferase B complex catalytic subunit
LSYLAKFPDLFYAAEAPNGSLMGYIMGKAEGRGVDWHGHVTAVSVAPEYRRLGVARLLMDKLEQVSNHVYKAYFVDLFVRKGNRLAIHMYENLGYVVYRRVTEYYQKWSHGPEEDAYDMRKSLSRDTDKQAMVPLKRAVHPDDVYFQDWMDMVLKCQRLSIT